MHKEVVNYFLVLASLVTSGCGGYANSKFGDTSANVSMITFAPLILSFANYMGQYNHLPYWQDRLDEVNKFNDDVQPMSRWKSNRYVNHLGKNVPLTNLSNELQEVYVQRKLKRQKDLENTIQEIHKSGGVLKLVTILTAASYTGGYIVGKYL